MATSADAPPYLTTRVNPADGNVAAAATMLSRKGFIVIAPPEVSVDSLPEGKRFHAIRGRKSAISLTRTEGRLIDTLVAARGAWCSRQRLMEAVWMENTPTDSALSFQLFNLRAKFRDCANAGNLIEASQGAVRLDPDALALLR